MIRFIVALDRSLGMAKNWVQPWFVPDDEKYFLEQTKQYGGEVLMGSRTYEVIGHPLKDRHNYIVTRDAVMVPGAEVVNDLDSFMQNWKRDLWVIGGGSIFSQTLKYADELYVTHIDAEFKCDVFFPKFDDSFMPLDEGELKEQNGFIYRFAVYTKK